MNARADQTIAAQDPTSPVIQHTRHATLETDDHDAKRRVEELLVMAGGRAQVTDARRVVASLPTHAVDGVLERLRALGWLRLGHETSIDLTAAVARAAADLRAAKEAHERTRKLQRLVRDVASGLALERALEEDQRAVLLAEERLREVRTRGTRTILDLRISAPSVERVPEPRLPFPWLDDLGLSRLQDTTAYEGRRDRELRAALLGQVLLKGAYADGGEADGTTTGAAALSFRTLGESSPAVGLFGGFDLAVGGGSGFLYDVQALGGLGFPLGQRVIIGVSSGPGIDSIGGAVPFGVSFPVEAMVYWDATRAFDVTVAVENAWVVASDERQDGSRRALFGDELAASLSVGLGERDDGNYVDDRVGFLVGVGYREAMGSKFYELRLGFGATESSFSGFY